MGASCSLQLAPTGPADSDRGHTRDTRRSNGDPSRRRDAFRLLLVIAVVGAVLFMMAFAGTVSRFVDKHPTFKMLALSFLLLIGFTLVADGLGKHVPKGYIYFAMGFSLFVEVLNLKIRKRAPEPVKLHSRM